MARLYVTDMIGEEYLTWQNKDQIILATPTGSGKTTFVVSRLLKHAVSMGKHVVYYCNRRVLRDQFEIQSQNLISQVFGSDLGLAEDAVKHLHIFTYQGAEDAGNYPHIHFLVEEAHDEVTTFQKQENGMQVQLRAHIADKYERVAPSEIMYYIFDEAHYFLSDSLIRHQGYFWADHDLDHSISVFLTATPKPLHLFLSMRRSLPFDHDFTSVYSARAQRTTLENQYDDIEWCITNILESWKVQDKVSFKLKCSPERKAAFMRRWHDPLRRYFWHIEQALKKAEEQPHYYRTEPDYSYLDVRYFNCYEELLPRIAQTPDDKWIIFVDSETAGNALLKLLQEANVGSVTFLSSSRINSNTCAKKVYNHIVEQQKFPCRILISTSVMDCGTNIHDPEVRHMAIASDSETTFLQELGRKRISEGERLQLYIRVYSYKQIHTRYYQLLDKLRFMIKVATKNYVNNTDRESFLSVDDTNRLLDDICSGKYSNLLRPNKRFSYFNSRHESIPRTIDYQKNANLDMLLDGLTYSKTAMTYVVHRLYDYSRALTTYRKEIGPGKLLVDFVYGIYNEAIYNRQPLDSLVSFYKYSYYVPSWDPFYKIWKNILDYKNENGELDFDLKVRFDDLFYLKHQLKWIGKEYDPTCWLDGSNKRTELIALLDIACESRPLRQGGAYHEQSDFAEQCKDLMLALPTPPKELKRNRSRYKDGKSPGINLLNKYLLELGLPYEIDSSKRELFDGVDKKKTVWTVKYKNAEESSADNHTSTE